MAKSEAAACGIEVRLAELGDADKAPSTFDDERRRRRLRALTADTSARFAGAGQGDLGRSGDPTDDLYDAAGLPR